jgi:hypothetical protein
MERQQEEANEYAKDNLIAVDCAFRQADVTGSCYLPTLFF